MHRNTSLLQRLTVALPLALVIVGQQRADGQARGPAPISIEAESLAGSAQVTQGKVVPQNMQPFGPGWSGGSQLFWGGTQLGAELRLSFTIAAAGRYDIFLHFTRAPDYAIVRASFDGAPWASFNGYATTVSRDRALVATRDLTPGAHELLLKVAMKAGQSQGLNVGLDRIALEPVSAPGSTGPSDNRTGAGRQIGALTQAVGASMVEGGKPPVPVLHIASGAAPEPQTIAQGIEPLPMSARISVTQQATSLPVNSPGQPLRLSASTPRVSKRAYLALDKGYLHANEFTEGGIDVKANATLVLSYFQVEAKQPHLLDCGVSLPEPAEIRLTAPGWSATSEPQFSKISMPKGPQRLLAVLVPEEKSFHVVLEPIGLASFAVWYCELTPFK
jgi:hypothetical protein